MFDVLKCGNREILIASSSRNASNCCQQWGLKEVFRFLRHLERKIMMAHPQQALGTDVGGKHGDEVPTLPCLTGHFLYLMFRCSTHGWLFSVPPNAQNTTVTGIHLSVPTHKECRATKLHGQPKRGHGVVFRSHPEGTQTQNCLHATYFYHTVAIAVKMMSRTWWWF